jgi:hypothetical protein
MQRRERRPDDAFDRPIQIFAWGFPSDARGAAGQGSASTCTGAMAAVGRER